MPALLERALADLPAKLRVHELAKRAGLGSKEVIAALAEAGVVVSSAASSVTGGDARALLTALLSGNDLSGNDVDPAAQLPVELPAASAPPAAPVSALQDPGFFAAPLFLPPVEAAPAGRRRRKPAAGSEPTPSEFDTEREHPDPVVDPIASAAAVVEVQEQDDAEQVGTSRSGRRRRGRSGSRSRDQNDQGRTGEPAEADSGDVDAPAQLPVADSTGDDVDRTAALDRAEKGASTVDVDAVVDEDEAEQAARRRRRRGRRGRGRIGDDRQDESELDDENPAGVAGTADTAPAFSSSNDDEDSTGDSTDDDVDDEELNEEGGTRRRRRRRRRTGSADGGDPAKNEDDPDNTVVHVREPRSNSKVEAPSSSSNEVQGVRGSTRLEAKRQRRRDTRGSRSRPQILTEAEFLARREAVDRVMAVRQRGDLAQVALLEDGILVEHFVSRAGSESLMGNIYLGKVQNVLPSMEAAFVDIGKGRNAVLYAGEVNWDAAGLAGKARRIETALSGGDTILVQVSKDPVGAKGARLTTQISLPGRFLVYVPGGGATGISRKLPDTERKRLKSILDRIVPEDAGVIIRTAAEGVAEEELARDVERLKSQWDEISRQAEKKSSAPLLLSAEPDTLIKVVRDLFNSDISSLILDGEQAHKPVAAYIDAVAPELSDRVSGYDGPNDVFSAYRIDEQIAKALERKVYLPSGGSLVIDRTEAMTVVDVNTGKYTGSGGNLEETVTKNNLEAAEEVVRQLRLRDIGGIIVVDFIDMVLESNRELVMRRLTECLGRDRTRHQVAEVTSLGLVQMTRKKMGTGLVEAFSEPCPHCHGRGLILHDVPVQDRAAGNDSDNSADGDKRAARGRRGRGRTEVAADPDLVVKVAPATVRPPDPRGPKPPSRGTGEEEPVDFGTPSADQDASPADPRSAVPSIESVRVPGARTDASLNAPRSRDASDAVSAVLAALDAQSLRQGIHEPSVPGNDAATAATSQAEPTGAGRRRGRRAAGRPAGAPRVNGDSAGQPGADVQVGDVPVAPQSTTVELEPRQPGGPDGPVGRLVAADATGAADSIGGADPTRSADSNRGADFNSNADISGGADVDRGPNVPHSENAGEAGTEPVPKPPAPRRRQAAKGRGKAAAVSTEPGNGGDPSRTNNGSGDRGSPAIAEPQPISEPSVSVPSNSAAGNHSASAAEISVEAPAPRRRRAASRPAGPATGLPVAQN
ncbi:MAG: translation initiation factor IF-2 N-terminal domain-containing protein [Nakamurella sp.]